MKATVDAVGRIVVPEPMRDALGLQTGASVDMSLYGPGLVVVPEGRTARLEDRDGELVAVSETVVVDDMIFRLVDDVRR